MNFRLFGNTGFQCSEIGLGCWQIGGGDWGAVDESQALKILSAATDEGVNFFDTADVYGGGRSEELIGRCLKGHTGGGGGAFTRTTTPRPACARPRSRR